MTANADDDKADLSGQVALVTGGGRGLGRAFAQALAESGAAVAVIARSEDQLAETVKLIESAGGRAIAIPGDVSDQGDVEQAVSTTEQQLGPIDLLVNNAGVASAMALGWEVDPNEWWRTLEINLRGPLLFARAVLPSMIARRNGRIINVSSGAAYNRIPYIGAYCASKAAITHWTNCLAGETQEYGVSVFAFTPGLVLTPAAKHIIESPDVPQPLAERFRAMFEDGLDTPIECSVEIFMFLASGEIDFLSGRCISVHDDEGELLRRVEEIQRDDLYTLRLHT